MYKKFILQIDKKNAKTPIIRQGTEIHKRGNINGPLMRKIVQPQSKLKQRLSLLPFKLAQMPALTPGGLSPYDSPLSPLCPVGRSKT